MHDKGNEDEKSFVQIFIRKAHRGQGEPAEDHWERTVVEFLNTREMEKLSPAKATERAERMAMATLWYTAKRYGRCPWCS
ncbi:DUF6313 family protein [Planotetraspora sp. GP83]|uniref:DUF6313 family protein n=1 Tax=Planotetraspora sp. GP83 TaxID=3156264 RepID=UPI003519A7BD